MLRDLSASPLWKRRRERSFAALKRRIAENPLVFVDSQLVGTPVEEVLQHPLDQWSSFEPSRPWRAQELEAVRRHRITLAVAVRWFEPGLREVVAAEQRSAAVAQLVMRAELDKAVACLEAAGVRVRVLKGLATAELDYPPGVHRQSGDIDLLVFPHDLALASDALERAGCSKHRLSNRVDPQLLKGETLVTEGGVEIDLHTRLNRYVEQDVGALMQRPCGLRDGLLALPVDQRLAHAAGHLLWTPYGTRRLSSLLDISAIVDKPDGPRISAAALKGDWPEVVGPALLIERAVRGRSTDPTLDLPIPSALVEAAFLRGRRSMPHEHLLALRGTRGARRRIEYVRSFVLPGGQYVERRGGRLRYYGRLFDRGQK